MRPRHVSFPRRSTVSATIGALAAAALLAACGGSSSDPSGTDGTLMVASGVPIGSLDPAKANAGSDPVYIDPLYAPLIKQQPDGTLKGVLASSWKYVGHGNKLFQITLRPGLKFSDGTPVNAAAVAASIKHFATGNNGTWLKSCPMVSAMSGLVVQVKCTSPQPVLPLVFTQTTTGGDIVSSASLAHPASLGTDPIGAGEYKLDTALTVPGSTYTYVRNPHYFDQSSIHYQQITVKSLPSSTSALDALHSGQLNLYFSIDPQALSAAAKSGLKVDEYPAFFSGVLLADRTPRKGNPIANLLVRQALEYAVDRPAIVKALTGTTEGFPTDQAGLPNQPTAWNAAVNDYYPYDPAKAKQLLAKAGYPNGFTVNVEDQTTNDGPVTQAVVGYWNKIGVKANITADPTIPGWLSNAASRKFPVLGYAYGGLPMYLQAINFFEPNAGPFNPFASSDPTIARDLATAASAPAAQQAADYQQVQAQGVKQAWYVGVEVQKAGLVYASGTKLASGHSSLPSVVDATPGS